MNLSNTPKQLVDHYGVFKDSESGYAWLLQQGVALSAIGLPDKYCPFKIKTVLLMCPHKFIFGEALERDGDLNEYEMRLKDSKVLQAFDPIYSLHEPRTVYIQVNNVKQYNSLIKLQRLMNFTVTSGTPASLAKEQSALISKRLRNSNLSSYVVYGLTAQNLGLIDELARAALITPGKLILAGDTMPLYNTKDLIEILKPDENLFKFIDRLPDKKVRAIGSHRLKNYMRSGCPSL